MDNILGRLYKVAKSYALSGVRRVDKLFEDVEKGARAKIRVSGPSHNQDHFGSSGSFGNRDRGGRWAQQVVEDLAVFDLKPPASMDDVRRARNREMKKYHADRFMHDPEKLETAKQLMQIYNAAYDRLSKFYQTRS